MVFHKNQLNDLQNENLQLQEKIEYFEKQVADREKTLAKFDSKLKNKKQQNLELKSNIDELNTRAESLMIDNSDLRAQLLNASKNRQDDEMQVGVL